MSNSNNSKSWEIFARIILRNRIVFLVFIFITTLLFSTQWKNLKNVLRAKGFEIESDSNYYDQDGDRKYYPSLKFEFDI